MSRFSLQIVRSNADKPAEVDHADKPAEVDDVKEAGVDASADEDARLDDEAEAPAAAEVRKIKLQLLNSKIRSAGNVTSNVVY